MRFPSAFLASAAAALLVACAPGPSRHSRYGDRETLDISSIPGDTTFDRAAFGSSPLPFWSQLTAPEVRALQSRDRAAAGDNRALLQLAVFASGDRRTEPEYAAITARFDAFVAHERPVIGGIADPDRKADRLLRDMHAGFFKPGKTGNGSQPGYDYDQSAFTGIFADGRFNCVSSAILYLLLAREFGYTAQGAVMPHHAYVHLVFPGGRSAEVETTTPDGYENAHAGASAPTRPSTWYAARGLDPKMALDYVKRRLVDPIDLIGFNMRNQHLFALSLRDRYRVLEGGAWVVPGDRQAQIDRIAVWEVEFQYLSGRGQWEPAHRLCIAIAPLLPDVHARLAAATDAAPNDHPAWLAYARSRTALELGNPEEAVAYGDTALAWIPAGGDAAGAIRGNVMGLLMRVSQKLVETGKFPAAEQLLQKYPGYAKDSVEYRGNLSWVYANWSQEAWKRSDWATAIERIEKALTFALPRDTADLEGNLAGAYFNRALAYRTRGDAVKATETLRHCRERVPRAKACRQEL
jgi:tetratricopeptide (TPR) repeat protein